MSVERMTVTDPAHDEALRRPLADNECPHGRLPTDAPQQVPLRKTAQSDVCECWATDWSYE